MTNSGSAYGVFGHHIAIDAGRKVGAHLQGTLAILALYWATISARRG